MKVDYKKIAKIVLPVSIVTIIVGYFLWTILIPIQDFHLMTDGEILRSQKELALNYPLGRFLLYTGFISLFTSAMYLIVNKIKN
jgi:hypothetical protein